MTPHKPPATHSNTKNLRVTRPLPNPFAESVPEELRQLQLRVQTFAIADYLWRRVLTSSEKQFLGNDFERAYSVGHTLGMWLRLKGGDKREGLIDLAHAVNLLSDQRRSVLLDSLGIKKSSKQNVLIPQWNRESRELRFGGKVIREISRPDVAKNIMLVLDEFERNGWPSRIKDPLPGGKNQQRLHAVNRSLNKSLRRIVFKADGTGQGFMWRLK